MSLNPGKRGKGRGRKGEEKEGKKGGGKKKKFTCVDLVSSDFPASEELKILHSLLVFPLLPLLFYLMEASSPLETANAHRLNL